MKRLLICCAAMAFWALDHTELAAQSSSRTGSYQSILSNSGVPSGSYGSFSTGSYGTAPGSYGQGYPGITTSYQQVGTNASTVGQPYSQTPAVHGSSTAAPMNQAVVTNSYGSCNSGAPVGGAPYGDGGCNVNGGCDSGNLAGAPYCNSPVGAAAIGSGSSRNWFYGMNGLIFDRDYEDDVFLTRDPMNNSLLSTDADSDTLGGLEFFLGSRNCNGNGWEMRYWGLFADEATATLTGATYQTYLTDLQGLIWPTTGEDLQTVFDRATTNTITRDNEIHNIEFNLLRRGGCYRTRWGQCANFELLHGFRWFEFDEEFHWDLTSAVAPTSLFFDTEVQNTLLGYQLGSRSNICLGRRLAFNWGTKFGIFNNRARVSQSIIDDAGVYATVGAGGADYDFEDDKNDISLLGELDLGFSYNIRQCSRVNIGYRAIGVSGIALAPDQYSNFNAATAIRDVQSNGDLLLHGAYVGMEFCR